MLNVLIGFYKAFTIIHLPGAFGFAIIALTFLIRTVVSPLTKTQLKSAQKMSQLKPQLDDLQKKHKEDKVKLQQAQMQLYKDAGVNPAAGCLPLLLQLPLFIALYNVFNQVLGTTTANPALVENINKVLYHPALHIERLDLMFLGIDLTSKPNQWQHVGIWILLIPVLTGFLQFIQTRLMMPPAPKIKPQEEDQMMAMQRQMALITPIMFGYLAFSFPIGLALYWNTFTVFGIMQQLQINKQRTNTL